MASPYGVLFFIQDYSREYLSKIKTIKISQTQGHKEEQHYNVMCFLTGRIVYTSYTNIVVTWYKDF